MPYRRPIPFRDWVWLVPVLIVAAFVGFGISMAIEPTIIDSLFGWLPTGSSARSTPTGLGNTAERRGS